MLIVIMFLCSNLACASENLTVPSLKNYTKSSNQLLNFDSVSRNSDIRLLSVVHDRRPPHHPHVPRHPVVKDYGELHHYRMKSPPGPPGKPKGMLSVIKTLGKGMGIVTPEESIPEYHSSALANPIEESNGWGGDGWGGDNHHHYHQKHVYTIKGSGGHSMYFSFLDIVLTGLSLISFGAFLLNLLMNLLSLGGFFTSTATYPTYTATTTGTATGTGTGGTATGTGGGITATGTGGGITATGTGGGITATGTGGGGITATGGGTITGSAAASLLGNNWFTRTFRKKRKKNGKRGRRRKKGKKLKKGTINAGAGFGNIKGKRKKRFALELYVDPKSSLDIAARSILNSIESMTKKYECMEKVVCDANKHAGIIGQGLEYFMPIYTFTASYFGRRLSLHEKLPNHLSAIILGVQESDCQSHFPHCESKR